MWPRWAIWPPRARRPTSVWHCTRCRLPHRRPPTTSRGTTSCCSVRHDRANGTDYLATLRAWLQAQGDPAEAGSQLGVHENTVRYRLRKMAEITNLSLDDSKKRLAMMIELAAIHTH